MANPVEAFLVLIGACVAAGAIGAAFVFGCAIVCRWMEWAPVNTVIHIHYHGEGSVSAVGAENTRGAGDK